METRLGNCESALHWPIGFYACVGSFPEGYKVCRKSRFGAGSSSTGTLACAGFAGLNKSAQARVPVLHGFFRAHVISRRPPRILVFSLPAESAGFRRGPRGEIVPGKILRRSGSLHQRHHVCGVTLADDFELRDAVGNFLFVALG